LSPSIIYRSARLYELAMLLLYGRHYYSRYRAIAELIPEAATVVDVCCGPGVLYTRYLRKKNVAYTGLDMNEHFVEEMVRRGVQAFVWDMRSDAALPRGDYVVMQASLYHFLPNPRAVLDRMLAAARKKVIVSEPIRNLSDSNSTLLSAIGKRFTNAGSGAENLRFSETSLDELMATFGSRVERSFLIPGGREKVVVIRSGLHGSESESSNKLRLSDKLS